MMKYQMYLIIGSFYFPVNWWLCKFDIYESLLIFTVHCNARIASAVLAMAIPSICHAGIVSKWLHVARCSLHYQQNVSGFLETKKYSPGTTLSPWNLGSNWPTLSKSSESWHVLPCSMSMVRASKKSSIMTNRKSYMGFPTSYRWSAYVTSKSSICTLLPSQTYGLVLFLFGRWHDHLLAVVLWRSVVEMKISIHRNKLRFVLYIKLTCTWFKMCILVCCFCVIVRVRFHCIL